MTKDNPALPVEKLLLTFWSKTSGEFRELTPGDLRTLNDAPPSAISGALNRATRRKLVMVVLNNATSKQRIYAITDAGREVVRAVIAQGCVKQ